MIQMKNFNKTSIIIMLAFIVIGIISGTVVYTKYPELAESMGKFIKSSEERSILTVFGEAFTDTFIIIMILMLLGFGSVFQPIELMTLVYRGFALGISFAYTYSVYALKGFFICVLMILPHALITSVILVLAVRESMRMSTSIAVFSFKGESDMIKKPDIYMYIIKFIVLIVMLLISSVLDCIITYLLTGMLILN